MIRFIKAAGNITVGGLGGVVIRYHFQAACLGVSEDARAVHGDAVTRAQDFHLTCFVDRIRYSASGDVLEDLRNVSDHRE